MKSIRLIPKDVSLPELHMRKPNKEFGEDKEQSYVSETSGFLAVSQNPQPSAMHQTLQLYPSTQFWLNLAVVAQDIQKRDHETGSSD